MHECGVCHQTMLFTRLIGKYKDKDNDTRLIHKDEYKEKYNMCKMQKMQTIANFEQY